MNHHLVFLACICCALRAPAFASDPLAPLLALPGTGADPEKIDYAALRALKGEHAVICPYDEQWKFQLHNYLLHHDGRFWCMWSAGPVVEDVPTQHVRYATSEDGLNWSKPEMLTGMPAEGRAYIARGFWVRDGELLALAASYKGRGAFGVDKDLKLVAFAWDKASGGWKEKGVLYDDAINNFAPEKIATGEWMMTRRDARFNVTMLIGGTKSITDWRVAPVVDRLAAVRSSKFSPDEPVWWEQPDGALVAAIRDNGGSGRLFRSVSRDHGQTWSAPAITNYPNATSKLFTLKTSRGYRVLVSNANPKMGRREMHLAISEDGFTFTRMARLDIPSPKATTFQYPHVIEHDGSVFIAFSNKKSITEVFKVALDDIDELRMTPDIDAFNYILGTQAIGQGYHFTDDTPLVESAKRIRALGSNIMKFAMSRDGSFGAGKGSVPVRDESIQSLVELATREPSHKAVLDMPFHDYFIWAYPPGCKTTAGQFKDADREYREMYDLGCHLLRTYSGTGKQFFLGHWEGDWHLRPHYDPKQGYPEEYRERFTEWLRVRQRAIDDARRDTPHHDVALWHYTEVNLVKPFLQGGECLTNDVLPGVDVDFVSYSCYESLERVIRDDLFAALDHIESKLRPRPGITGKRVFIGEYGFPARRHGGGVQNRKTIETMRAAIEWGCPFALYWELYCNEVRDGKHAGFWLIDDRNVKQPVWFTHEKFFQQARQYVADYTTKHGAAPTDAEYRKEALRILDGLAAQPDAPVEHPKMSR